MTITQNLEGMMQKAGEALLFGAIGLALLFAAFGAGVLSEREKWENENFTMMMELGKRGVEPYATEYQRIKNVQPAPGPK